MSSDAIILKITLETVPPVIVTLVVDSDAISLIAATRLEVAVVVRLDKIPILDLIKRSIN